MIFEKPQRKKEKKKAKKGRKGSASIRRRRCSSGGSEMVGMYQPSALRRKLKSSSLRGGFAEAKARGLINGEAKTPGLSVIRLPTAVFDAKGPLKCA